MEDFIEIIIYALLVLGSLAGKLYKDVQKKKGAQEWSQRQEELTETPEEVPQPQSRFPEFPSVLEEFLETTMASQEVKRENEPIDVIENEYSYIEEFQEYASPLSSEEEGSSVFENTPEVLVSDGLTKTEVKKESPTDEDLAFNKDLYATESEFEFDPVKAVIYAEIIGQKKY